MLKHQSHSSRPGTSSWPPTRRASLDILVVDDDAGWRESLRAALLSLGHSCRVAANGAEALALHHSQQADVIICDFRMPHMNGEELCQRVRAVDDDRRYTFFTFVSAYDDKTHFLRGMKAGADDYWRKPVDLDELEARLVSTARVVALHRRLEARNVALRRDSQTSFRAARTDPLTEVANRRRLNEDLERLRRRAIQHGELWCAAICDIDHFKRFNDRYGHPAGDEALRRVAQAIRSSLRESDHLYRYGGEEFLALLPSQSLEEAARAMDRVRVAVRALDLGDAGVDGPLSISIGVGELDTETAEPIEHWIERTDQALYRAKSAGRDRVEVDGGAARRAAQSSSAS